MSDYPRSLIASGRRMRWRCAACFNASFDAISRWRPLKQFSMPETVMRTNGWWGATV